MVKLWRAETPLIISKIFEEKARKLVRNFFRMQQNNRHGQSFKSKGNCLGHWDQSLEPKYSFSKFSGSPSSGAPLPLPTCSQLVCGVWCPPAVTIFNMLLISPHLTSPRQPPPPGWVQSRAATQRGGNYLPSQPNISQIKETDKQISDGNGEKGENWPWIAWFSLASPPMVGVSGAR